MHSQIDIRWPGGIPDIEIALDASHAGWRLDRALAAAVPTLSRERLKALITAGALTREGKAVATRRSRSRATSAFTLAIPDPDAGA